MVLLDTDYPAIDGKIHHINIEMPFGGGGGSYYITIDNYHRGQIVKYINGWTWKGETDLLTSDDIGAIMDMVNAKDDN